MRRLMILLACASAVATGCTQTPEAAQGPAARNAADATPLAAAGKIAAIRGKAMAGDTHAVQAGAAAMQKQLLHDMRLPDPTRPIDHEAARAAVIPLPGVSGVVWVDRSNLLVMVRGGQFRSMAMIDRVCHALTPLGDTLAVVVNLQDIRATTSAGAESLSRNCQLPPGERALMQGTRRIDAIDPVLRRAFEAQQRSSRR
ncbi:MAG TPA: hypothetical protein VFN09_05440 [Rhodanobacteraceae bacterium]|nr:hypothetical protein [Rhodanobacteraceae bacterium]